MGVVDLGTAANLHRETGESLRARGQASDDLLVEEVCTGLRGPLSDILSATDALLSGARGPLNDLQSKSLRTIDASTRRVRTVIVDLASYCAAAGGHVHLRFDRVPLAHLCQSAIYGLEAGADARQVSLELFLHDRDVVFEADGGRASEMLSHLLSRAIEHTPRGGRVLLTAWADGEAVRFCVEHSVASTPDLGASVRDRRATDDVALALATCLAQLHGGTVAAEGESSHGCRITLTLPSSRAAKD